MFAPIEDILIPTAAVAISFNCKSNHPQDHNIGDTMDFESARFPDVWVRLPLVGPVELAMQGLSANSNVVEIVTKASNSAGLAGPNLQRAFNHIISPGFTTFYENHVEWLCQNVGDRSAWPTNWDFARVVRNVMSHNGTVNIDSHTAPTVSWYGYTLGHADRGKRIIGTDLTFADLIILLIEMGDDLDRLGCPIQP